MRADVRNRRIPGIQFAVIRIFDRFTFVEVPSDEAEGVIAALHKKTIGGTRINVSHARGR